MSLMAPVTLLVVQDINILYYSEQVSCHTSQQGKKHTTVNLWRRNYTYCSKYMYFNGKILFGTPRRNKFPRHPCNIRDHSGKYYISVTVVDWRVIKVALTVACHSHAL